MPDEAYKHPDFPAQKRRWEFAWDVYTGEYAYPGKIDRYLKRRRQGEHPKAYAERKSEALADPALDMAAVVDSLVGLLFSNPEQVSRQFRETGDEGQEVRDLSLGDPQEEGTRAHRVRTNIDGRETSLRAMNKQVATRLTAKHTVWGLVDGAVTAEDGQVVEPPKAMYVEPESVINWRGERGRLVEVLTDNPRDTRQSVFEDPEDTEPTFVHYTLDGWRIVDSDGTPLSDLQEYEYVMGSSRAEQKRVLPIFRQTLDLPRDVGYLMARKCCSLFNMESELDAYGRLTNLPRLGIASNRTGKDFEELTDDIAAGRAILQIPPEGNTHQYIIPPSEHMESRKERLKSKRQDFYSQSFREYGDSAAQTTATEMKQTWAAGVLAYLTHLARAVEKFESRIFKRLEQAEFPDNPDAWGQHSISMTVNVDPEDSLEILTKALQRVWGAGGVPLPKQAKAQILVDWLDELGQDADVEDVVEAIESAEADSERMGAQSRNLL